MTTLKECDLAPALPRDEGGPVFAEPWQAQAFALAVRLTEQGHFTKQEWARALGDQIKAAEARSEAGDGSRYYEHWLAALETLVAAKGLTTQSALRTRKDEWAAAYRNTRHGKPVELRESRLPDVRWIVLGLAGTLGTLWSLQYASVESVAAGGSFGMLLGMRHALEPDHMAAVSTLLTGERHSSKAAWLGTCWGLGHALTLFVTGLLLVVFQTEMPTGADRVFELGVIALLIGFGVRAIYQGARRAPSGPTHTHGAPARSAFGVDRWTFARPFLVGAVHGLAGSGALIALVVTTLPSTPSQLSYLLMFGAGSTVGMAALSGLMGWPIARLGASPSLARTVSMAVGCVSVALGIFWVAR
jgi:nitrile hydratase accessory protein